MLPREIREGTGPEQPCTITTKVGWYARGVLNNGRKNRQGRINIVQQEDSRLNKLFREFITNEDFDTECDSIVKICDPSAHGLSNPSIEWSLPALSKGT